MTRRILIALLILLALVALSPSPKAEASGGGYWAYSSYYQPGYTYYYAGYYGGQYWNYGYYRYYPPVVQYVPVYQTYVQPIAFSTFQPAAVTVGTTLTLNAATPVANLQAQAVAPLLTGIGVAGQAQAVQAQPAQPAGAVDACEAKFEAMMARYEAKKAREGKAKEAPPAQQAKGINAVLTTNCGKCHEAATAEKEGGSFTLLKDGQPVALTDRQQLAMWKQIVSGKMPKGSKLSEEDGQALLGYLDQLKSSETGK